jgi:hypothetical protein
VADDQDSQQPKFTIRRLPPREPVAGQATPAPSPPQPRPRPRPTRRDPPPQPPTPEVGQDDDQLLTSLLESRDRSATGGLFRTASSVLAFLGSALGTAVSDEAAVRRAPNGDWWGEVDASFDTIASLIWTTGGQPFARNGNRWVAATSSGERSVSGEGYEVSAVAKWPVVELASLLAETNLLPGRYRGTHALDVVVPGSLGRWILRRSTALGLRVGLVPALRRPLSGAGGEAGILLLRLRAEHDHPIPAAFVHSLTQLPYLIVGEPIEADGRSVLVDIRHRLPLAPTIVQNMVPVGETWVLGPPDAGYWRLRSAGAEIDGSALMQAPSLHIIDAPADATLKLPEAIPVQLVTRPGSGSRVDAVLLDAAELHWLRLFLMGRPTGEVSFLLPGQDVYLLAAPGGLPAALPFGVPLARVGPGGLYLELGIDFYPPLPDGARQARFALTDESAVAVTRKGAYRFDTAQMLPAWALWVGAAPAVQGDLSKNAEQLLMTISALIRQAEAKQIAPPQPAYQPIDRKERARLLEQAQRAELAGNLLRAAELLERAGYPGPAGRLYERAAAP